MSDMINLNVYTKYIYNYSNILFIMARAMNPLRLTTPIVILKTTKTRLRRLAKDHTSRKGTESDEMIIFRLLTEYEQKHLEEIREPQTTYRVKKIE